MNPYGRMFRYMKMPPGRGITFKVGDAVRPVPGAKSLTDNITFDGTSYAIVKIVSPDMIHIDDDLNGRCRLAPEDLKHIKKDGK